MNSDTQKDADLKLIKSVRRLTSAALKAAPTWKEDVAALGFVINKEMPQDERAALTERVSDYLRRVWPAAILEVLEQRESLVAELNLVLCVHCRQRFTQEGITAHILSCERNPVVVENQNLKARVRELEERFS